MGSLNTQGEILKELLREHCIDVAFIQEHRIPLAARHRVKRDWRAEGWRVFFGPERPCGFGQAIVGNHRWSATQLGESQHICSVGLRLTGEVMVRLGCVYAPVPVHGTQQQFFSELDRWMGLPGMWFAAGNFNPLSSSSPVSGIFRFPDAGTWRRSAQHDWINPIDGFLCNSMMCPGRTTSLGSSVLSQHAPALCQVPCADPLGGRLAWQIPDTITLQPTDDMVEAFRASLREGRGDDAWNLWRYMAFGLGGEEELYKPVSCAVLVPGGGRPTAS